MALTKLFDALRALTPTERAVCAAVAVASHQGRALSTNELAQQVVLSASQARAVAGSLTARRGPPRTDGSRPRYVEERDDGGRASWSAPFLASLGTETQWRSQLLRARRSLRRSGGRVGPKTTRAREVERDLRRVDALLAEGDVERAGRLVAEARLQVGEVTPRLPAAARGRLRMAAARANADLLMQRGEATRALSRLAPILRARDKALAEPELLARLHGIAGAASRMTGAIGAAIAHHRAGLAIAEELLPPGAERRELVRWLSASLGGKLVIAGDGSTAENALTRSADLVDDMDTGWGETMLLTARQRTLSGDGSGARRLTDCMTSKAMEMSSIPPL